MMSWEGMSGYQRILVETVVDSSLRSLPEDPKRSLRKLIDIGEGCATGRLQKRFLRMAQDMLENEDSPYYDMVLHAVETIDHNKLKTFGINFGWNCLTVGAKQIRAYEQENQHNVPWELTLHIGSRAGDLQLQDYDTLLEQAKQMGIYCYFLFPEDESAIQIAFSLASSEKDSDFFLFLPIGTAACRYVDCFGQLDNLLIAVDSGGAGWKESAECLREAGCIYALYRRYNSAKDVEDIVSGAWVQRILPYAGIAAICVAGSECSLSNSKKVYRYALDSRMRQRYPVLMADLYLDSLATDICISDGECFVGILPDGGITEFYGGHERGTRDSVRTAPLSLLLRRFAK